MSRSAKIAALVVGVAMFVAFRIAYGDDVALFPRTLAVQVMFLPLVLAASFIRPIRDAISRAIDRVRHPATIGKAIGAITCAAIAILYLWRAAILHGRDLSPRMQDEFSYLIQAQLLAIGRLWLPSPPLADSFETFHVIVKPMYASVYFPGTAMLYVPGVWMNAPHYWTALLICAASVGLIYLFATELLDGAYGILAALMLLTTRGLYLHSTLALSNVPAMLAGVIACLAWLKWTRANSAQAQIGSAILIGAASGWGLIVRPLDTIAYLVPIVCLTVGTGIINWRRSLLPVLLAALPFLSLQLVFNKGLTGQLFTTPYQAYFDDFQPSTRLGFASIDPTARPKTDLKQKHDLYDVLLRPLIEKSRWEMFLLWRIKFTVFATLPSDLLLILLPLGAVVVLRHRKLLVCLLTPILFLALYALYPYYMPYYALAIAPCVIVLSLAGARVIAQNKMFEVFVMSTIAALCLAALPETRLDFGEELDGIPGLGGINQRLPQAARPPAVVLFTYIDGVSPHEEPVYNYDVANPLDAPIVRAHDLGEQRNREIFRYFATHRPETTFYRFDRGRRQLEKLGTAQELLDSPR